MEKYSLHVKCPYCSASFSDTEKLLDDKPSIKVNVEFEGTEGQINFSAVYGSYKHEANIEIPDDRIARFSCPSCNNSLVTIDQCDECKAPMAAFTLEKGGKVYFCTRHGCDNHALAFKYINDAMLKFHQTYGHQ
jgi:predicted RNA-binding Zn-ribbon protein involved in translation (DUF1610 family)